MSETHEFPEYTDAAGVHWTAEFTFGDHVRLCVCDAPGGQLGFALVGLEESYDTLMRRLPPAADRAEILNRIRDDVKAWRKEKANV